MEKIDIKEVHCVLLNIMKEIHRICEHNNIPYYIAGGTMLGAVRHKGFIPWDDDIDICVPRQHYDQFIEAMNAELPSPYRVVTYKEADWMVVGYAKVQDTSTLIDDTTLKCSFDDMPGVNIDVFPLDACSSAIDWGKVKRWRTFISLRSSNFIPSNKYRAFLRKLAVLFIAPFVKHKNYYVEKIDAYAKQQSGDNLFTVWGRYGKDKEIIPAKYWGEPTLYDFEDTKFYGVEDADSYLTHLYGDYMQLPSVEKRFVHVDNIYRK